MIFSLLLIGALLPHVCLTASVNVDIVNGREARPHSRPYMVSIQKNNKHDCGGFLISEKFVLTAAHCRENTETLTVVAGAHDLTNSGEGHIRINVTSYDKHPDYDPEATKRADLMILKLNQKVQLNNKIKTIPIPKTPVVMKTDSDCSVAGWGFVTNNGPVSPKLMEANVKIRNNNDCAAQWDWRYFPSEMMCVYGSGGSCEGDSGGPLVCGGTAVGVTSFGSTNGCNDADKSEVYIQISAFLPWIKNITGIGL